MANTFAQTNWVQLTPVTLYYSTGPNWEFKPQEQESPADTRKGWYFDGINTGTFDDEDTLMTVTWSNGWHTNYLSGEYKVQHVEYRQADGTFRSFYLYVARINDAQPAFQLHRKRTLNLK